MTNIDRSRILNTTNTNLPEYVLNTIAKDPKHVIKLDKVQQIPTNSIITEIEDNIKKLPTVDQNKIRLKVTQSLMLYNNKLKATSQSKNAEITDLKNIENS
ncbi:hypothetical protein HHI36_019560 [Cryptolaemus montrouzieri]|uniref:Uncharacterized protein n=1 Tax=Cryptolaemus montrouzieri TaxID=559131 RepID=A0ABD2N8V3_9CUCU